MKQSILDRSSFEEISLRAGKLNEDSHGRWGKLNANQMIRHLSLACTMAFDEVVVPDMSNVLTRTLGKWMFLSNIKPPGREKGKIQTFPQIDVVKLQLPVDSLEKEKAIYRATLQRITETEKLSNRHPLFGKMSRKDWGYLTYAHADYHLTQFSV